MAPRCCCSSWTSVTMILIGFFLSTCMAQNLTTEEQQAYLTNFGYLGEVNPDPEMQALQDDPDRQFELAVRTFQRFAGLNQTGVVDDATIAMMKMPRCGVPDTVSMGGIVRRRKRYTLTGDRWNKRHLTYRFLRYTPDLPQSTIRRVFVQAFKMWSDVSALSFSETSQVSDIEITFAAGSHGDRYPFDGQGGTLAHAFFPTSAPIGGDAHFDEDETWTDATYDGTNLLQVAVHEIGHSLGLGHSDVQNSIMAPFYRGYKPGFTLDQDDINGIRHLYGRQGGGQPTSIGPPTTTTPRDGITPSTLPPDYCPLAGFCRDFDAIDVIGNTIHAFKGEFYARLSNRGVIIDVERIQTTWPALPTHLDAVMSTYSYVYFFKGDEYWRMSNSVNGPEINSLTRRELRRGFPGAPSNMDAAFVWSGNGRIYFIKGGQYWRYRGRYGIDRGYPKSLSIWRNVQRPVDDVFQYYGVTYFFSGTGYQVFNDYRFYAGTPRSTKDLMQCCTREQELLAQVIGSTPSYNNSSPTALKFASISHLGFMLLLFSALSALL